MREIPVNMYKSPQAALSLSGNSACLLAAFYHFAKIRYGIKNLLLQQDIQMPRMPQI